MLNNAKQRLQELKARKGNDDLCAECNAHDPEYASYNLGVFLCTNCCSVHRGLGTHISKTKSLYLENWENSQIQALENGGNDAAATIYLQHVPACYPRPQPNSAQVVREQWIRAKYDRREFQDINRQIYLQDHKLGYLWKKGRDDSKFLERKFELNGRSNQLLYFTKEGARTPKAVIPLDQLNCWFAPGKIGNPNGMQISYEHGDSTRNIYVYAEDGQVIMDWYVAIRHTQMMRLRIGLPHLSEKEIADRMSREFTLEGWLFKAGPNPRDAWRRRWFTLDGRMLRYANEPLSAYDNGEIFVGHHSDKCDVQTGAPAGRTDKSCSFTLSTPQRDYALAANCENERQQWMSALKNLINTELSSAVEVAQRNRNGRI